MNYVSISQYETYKFIKKTYIRKGSRYSLISTILLHYYKTITKMKKINLYYTCVYY